ncbi:membrane protein insertion efficiency factor YidD, partial [Geodermatophilus chilensis]|uniref:membrane protein insertion efficiency factor YidD n=1 Tax=Geodermatophilus chilensis TaxID=2035835 RepID=UPI001E34AE16
MTADPRAPRDGRGPLARALLAVVGFYQRAISPAFPPRCRFQPTCSAYAAEAIAVHGAGRGSWLALRRLLKWCLLYTSDAAAASLRVDLPGGRTIRQTLTRHLLPANNSTNPNHSSQTRPTTLQTNSHSMRQHYTPLY